MEPRAPGMPCELHGLYGTSPWITVRDSGSRMTTREAQNGVKPIQVKDAMKSHVNNEFSSAMLAPLSTSAPTSSQCLHKMRH